MLCYMKIGGIMFGNILKKDSEILIKNNHNMKNKKRVNTQINYDDYQNDYYTTTKIYYYFPDYNKNIVRRMMYDEIALYSITKQGIADTMTIILKGLRGINRNSRILDATSCVGGNTISFCNFFVNVDAIEIDETRYNYLKHNLELFGHSNIDVMNTDCVHYIQNLDNQKHYDIMFFDPPWGGPEYKNKKNVMIYLQDVSMIQLLHIVKEKTVYCVIKVPLNFDFISFSDETNHLQVPFQVYKFDKMAMIIVHFGR